MTYFIIGTWLINIFFMFQVFQKDDFPGAKKIYVKMFCVIIHIICTLIVLYKLAQYITN